MIKYFKPPTEAEAVAKELRQASLLLLAARSALEQQQAHVNGLVATQRRLKDAIQTLADEQAQKQAEALARATTAFHKDTA